MVNGWPLLAKKMIDTPEFEAVSRFRQLNMKNLLYFQVELADLEEELTKSEQNDNKSGEEYCKYADRLVLCQLETDSSRRTQWDLVIKIRNLLKEYSKVYKYNPDGRVLMVPPLL